MLTLEEERSEEYRTMQCVLFPEPRASRSFAALTVIPLDGGVAAAGTGTRLHRGVRLRPFHLPLAGAHVEHGYLRRAGREG